MFVSVMLLNVVSDYSSNKGVKLKHLFSDSDLWDDV